MLKSKSQFFIGLFSILLLSCSQARTNESLVDYVNLYIGTTGEHTQDYGGTLPSVTMPFGMTQWCAMTRENEISVNPYHYNDSSIIGFIGTHQPNIWMGDYGFVSFMPQTGSMKIAANDRALPFRHEDEKVSPYFYSVAMGEKNKKINVEMTASIRCSMTKILYPTTDSACMSIEISREKGYPGYVKILSDKKTVIGYSSDRQTSLWGMDKISPELKNFKGYFVIQFDKEIQSYSTWNYVFANKTRTEPVIEIQQNNAERTSDRVGAYISFGKLNSALKVKIATSFISFEQAYQNLANEIPDWDFQKVSDRVRDIWEEQFQRVKVEGGTHDQKVSFYTAMCRSLQYPRIFSEYGRYYSAFDDSIHKGISYNDYSLWDTFRALHPWLTIAAPEHVSPMITSMLQMYKEGGWLPMWPNPAETNIMIGTHSDAVIADAVNKDFKDFDLELAYQAVYKNAMTPPDGDATNKWLERDKWAGYEARGGLTDYKKLGYLPVEKYDWSASKTMEFAYNDYCVAQVAKAVGKTDDYKFFMSRSGNYKNVYNKEIGFMQGRNSNGEFVVDDENKLRAFCEGSHWEYLFCAMHDIPGLIQLMGGAESFEKKLDENFTQGHYRHANEPGHHYAYLYNYVGKPWKTQKIARELMGSLYSNTPDGLCGNDDCGQMSAWYLFSAMGFYPVAPGSGEYAIGSPIFDKVTINLRAPYPNKKIKIIARNVSEKNKYVKSVSIDGKKLDKPFISHKDIVGCNEIVFEMVNRH